MKFLLVLLSCFLYGMVHSQTFVIHPADSGRQTVHIDKKGNPVDTTVKENTAEEKAAIKTAYDALDCNCSGTQSEAKLIHGDGVLILFKQGKIIKKGCFSQKKLICGIECMYDSDGKLIRLKKIENGKVTGEIPFPAE